MAFASERTLWRLLALSVVPAVLAACNGGGAPPGPPTPTATTPTPVATSTLPPTPHSEATPSPTAEPSVTPSPSPFEGSRGPVEADGTAPGPTALLVDVRAARHDGFDRIVFEFDEGYPAYRIEYVEPPVLGEFSGEPVAIAGGAFLRVAFFSAASYDPLTGDQTYPGPREISAGLPSLREAEVTGDFEGRLTWVLGLTDELEFRVATLDDGGRVVIDVAHP